MTQQRVVVRTLVDVTSTNLVHVRDSNKPGYHQMQNLKMLIQIIGLRAQPFDVTVKKHTDADMSKFDFDISYSNNAQDVWEVEFYHEHPHVWSDGVDEFAMLIEDAHGVPISSDLDNTADFPVDIFDTKTNVNTYFTIS